MKLVIGMTVLYHVLKEDEKDNNFQPVAPAIVTRIWTEDCINIRVVFDGLNTPQRTSVIQGNNIGNWSFIE